MININERRTAKIKDIIPDEGGCSNFNLTDINFNELKETSVGDYFSDSLFDETSRKQCLKGIHDRVSITQSISYSLAKSKYDKFSGGFSKNIAIYGGNKTSLTR